MAARDRSPPRGVAEARDGSGGRRRAAACFFVLFAAAAVARTLSPDGDLPRPMRPRARRAKQKDVPVLIGAAAGEAAKPKDDEGGAAQAARELGKDLQELAKSQGIDLRDELRAKDAGEAAPPRAEVRHLTMDDDEQVNIVQDEEALLLFAAVRALRPRTVLEFGAQRGFSARNFLAALEGGQPGARLFMYDMSDDRAYLPRGAAKHPLLASFDVGDQRAWHCGRLPPAHRMVDFVFIDSCHAEACYQSLWRRLSPCLAAAAVVVVHGTGLHAQCTRNNPGPCGHRAAWRHPVACDLAPLGCGRVARIGGRDFVDWLRAQPPPAADGGGAAAAGLGVWGGVPLHTDRVYRTGLTLLQRQHTEWRSAPQATAPDAAPVPSVCGFVDEHLPEGAARCRAEPKAHLAGPADPHLLAAFAAARVLRPQMTAVLGSEPPHAALAALVAALRPDEHADSLASEVAPAVVVAVPPRGGGAHAPPAKDACVPPVCHWKEKWACREADDARLGMVVWARALTPAGACGMREWITAAPCLHHAGVAVAPFTAACAMELPRWAAKEGVSVLRLSAQDGDGGGTAFLRRRANFTKAVARDFSKRGSHLLSMRR